MPLPDGPTLFWISAVVLLGLAWWAGKDSLAERLATALQVFLFGGCRRSAEDCVPMWEPTKSLHNLEVLSREVERYSSRRLPFRGSFVNNLLQ